MNRFGSIAAAAGVVAASLATARATAGEPPVLSAGHEITIEFDEAPGQVLIPAPAPPARVAEKEAKAEKAAPNPAPARAVPPVAAPTVIQVAPAQVMIRQAMGNQPAGDPARLEPIVAQMTQQLRPFFRAELKFLSSTAGPSPEQRRAIAVDGGRAVKEAARKNAEVQQALQVGGWRGGSIPDARKTIRDALAASAKARLGPEQFARYQAEVDRRVEDQHRAIVLNLVVILDRLLILSPEQRDKLAESLLSRWDDRSFPSLENLANYDTYTPNLPDPAVLPVLNPAQRRTWQATSKVTFGQSINFNLNVNGQAPDPLDEDEDEKAAFAEEKTP